MPVLSRGDVLNLSNQLRLTLTHFVRGTFPEADGRREALPVNRFFLPLSRSGKTSCFIADESEFFPLIPGRAYFIPCYHPARVKLDRKLEFISIQFRLELTENVDLFSRTPQILELDEPVFRRKAAEAYAEKNALASASGLFSVTMEFSRTLLKRLPPEQVQSAAGVLEFSRELEYLRKRGTAATTVEELASLHGVARETFSRRFTAVMGRTPKTFLNHLLLDRAARFLERTDLRIGEIAGELGFSNAGYFARFFLRHTGMSPRKFRERHVRG